MIPREEVEEKGDEFDLDVDDVQRDYVFGWLIHGLFTEGSAPTGLVLKGGNAFRKGYLPSTRFSEDLDFGIQGDVDAPSLVAKLNDACKVAEGRSGVKFDTDKTELLDVRPIAQGRQVFTVGITFCDFAGEADHARLKVAVDVIDNDRLLLPVQSRRLVHQYSDAAQCSCEIRCAKLEELLADKLRCLLQRRHCHDLFDLAYAVFIARELDVNRPEIVNTFLQKTIFEASPVAALRLLLGAPLEAMRHLWDTLVCPVESRLDFDAAQRALLNGLTSLFEGFDYGGEMLPAFFPPEMRNPIMEAAERRKLLRVTYNGAPRNVEPYSLAFKRRKDGAAQEYFYCYDQTGGSSGPGIKCLVSGSISSISVTEQDFLPRHEIELSKAGDAAAAGYFAGRTGFRRVGSGRARRSSLATYTVECGACGKKFRRIKPGTKLNKHTDGYGNPCYGRHGYSV